jgi:hypothetical protein
VGAEGFLKVLYFADKDIPHMKFALPLILLSFLTGCSGRVIDLSQSGAGTPVDTGPEILHISVPAGSKVGYQANRPGVQD